MDTKNWDESSAVFQVFSIEMKIFLNCVLNIAFSGICDFLAEIIIKYK